MSDVTIEWDGDDPEELAAKFEEFDRAVEDNLEDAMNTVVKQIAADASEKAPYKTGWLSSNIRGIALGWVGEVLEGAVGTNVHYAPHHEYGTDPYTITGDPLAFEDGGDTAFASSVRHPGIEPTPFLHPAIDENREWALGKFEQAVQDASDEVF